MTTISEGPVIIPPMLSRSLDFLPDPYCIRSIVGPILYANLAVAKLLGVRSPCDIIDRDYHEISSRLLESEETLTEWDKQDKNLSITRKAQAMLELHPHAVDTPYICRKVPFYDNDHQCVGVFLSIKYLEVFTPNDFVKGKLPGSLLLNKPDDFFTEKECEIIFFRLQGMGCKEIADILCLSKRTVENRIAAMYQKAGVNHFDDFVAFCQRLDLHRYIPRRIVAYKKIGFREDYEQNLCLP